MAKLIAILNVVVWSGFWAFGYLALTSGHDGQILTALVLAALGGGAGLWLVRHSEQTGYAPRPPRADPDETETRERF